MVEAAYYGDETKVSAFLKEGVDVNFVHLDNGATALFVASQEGHVEIVKALLAKENVEVDYADIHEGGTALIIASQSWHVEIVQALLAKCPSGDFMSRMNRLSGAEAPICRPLLKS